MSIVHIAFYPSDWLAGTRGLSAEETGVYITLIARMYEMAAPIERDDNRLARLCGCKTRTGFVRCLEYLIAEGKITEVDGGLFNDRVEKELQNTTEKSSKAKQAAEARWKKNRNKNKDRPNADASAKHMLEPCQSEPEPEEEKEELRSSKKKGSRLSPDWRLPDPWRRWAIDQGMTPDAAAKEGDRFRDYWIAQPGQKAVKVNWQATWRNWVRNSLDRQATRQPADFWTGPAL